jgi:putative membrane-bound dehydrogenase-like protein
VKWSIAGSVALTVVVAFPLFAQQPPVDITQEQSPTKPAPKWLKIIDQGKNDPRLKGYFTPEGLKVEIVADYPTVVNPVGMTFAEDGTPYVLEWQPDIGGSTFPEFKEEFTFKDGSKRLIATMKKRVPDAVKVLRDSKGVGNYDKADVILEHELPSSILLHDGWLYLSGRGKVHRYKQSKPGGKYDIHEVIAQGFCGYHHHQVSGLTIGNDGWLYITSGDNDNYVEGSDGSRATVLRTGAIFRCRPDGSRMQVHSIGYRNPYRDVAFDVNFNMFHADNDNEDGSKFQGCRLMHIVEGNDFGWRLFLGAPCCKPDLVRGAVYGELPGKVPPLIKTGRGSPAGLLIYNDTFFPKEYQGLLYYPDVFRKLIRAYKVEPKGATFEVAEEFEFMKSEDPLFRPCQMVLGPDGAMYIVDWRTNSGGAGQLWGDGVHGRIYRVSWAGTEKEPVIDLRGRDSWAKIGKMSQEDLLKTLASPRFSDRQAAQQELVRRGPRCLADLLKIVRDPDQLLRARIAALGASESLWNSDVELAVFKLLQDKNATLRRLAADALELNADHGDKNAHAALLRALDDRDPAVQRAVALAIGQINGPGAADDLVSLLAFDLGKDPVLTDGIVRAIEKLGKEGIDRLLSLADSGVPKDLDKVVGAFEAMRIRAAAEALPMLLKNPHLTVAERAGLLRSFNNYELDPPIALEPAFDYIRTHPDEDLAVKLAAVEVLTATPLLKRGKGQDWLLPLLDVENSGARLAVIRAVEEARVTKASPRLIVFIGDAKRPLAERIAAVKALRVLNDNKAAPVLKEILQSPPVAGPEGAAFHVEIFRTLAALNAAAAHEAARGILEQKDSLLRIDAVQILGTQPGGAAFVGKLYLDKKLPREMLPQVADNLRKHAEKNPEIGQMLKDVMKSGLLFSTEPAEVEKVRRHVQTKGNAQRGRELYLNGKMLACINCHRMEGVGGNVGPDLTRLWETSTVEKTIESILDPSKEIKEGYQMYKATTKKGLVYQGLKIAQTPDEVVLRDATAKDVHIPAKDLDELVVSKASIMPEGVVAQLSYDQFIDLIAFLKDRGVQESLRGLVFDYYVVGPFGEELKTAYPPETKPDPSATYSKGKPGEVLVWHAAQAGPNGLLNVRDAVSQDHASIYALTYVYSMQAQKLQMLLGSNGAVKVWINGEMIHEHAQARKARPDEDQVEVSLKEGWNTVLVKIVNAEGDNGLYLRFSGRSGIRVARKPE